MSEPKYNPVDWGACIVCGYVGDLALHTLEKHTERMRSRRTEAGLASIKRDTLPAEPEARKAIPITTGVLDYFPAALAEVARVSKAGNDQHNPGEPLHWARGKSMDQADCIVRHLMERGTIDTDGVRHSAKLAWRALALLQLELEAEGAPLSRGSEAA